MIGHERVAENVYSFQSEAYAQVNSGVIAGPRWAVVVDTLAFPDESRGIRDFVEQELKIPVRYVINTHYHADHSWGNANFPGALVVASQKCRDFLTQKGVPALAEAKRQNPTVFGSTEIKLPNLTFDKGYLGFRVGKKTLKLLNLPGNSDDGIGVLIEEDRVLFAGDVFMPVPYIVDGDMEQMITSLEYIASLGLENIIQGHGDIVLRGEIEGIVKDNVTYLRKIESVVKDSDKYKYPLDFIERTDIASCGKSRVLLGGLAEELHRRNMIFLFKKLYGELPVGSEDVDDYWENDDYEYEDEEADKENEG